MSIPFDLIENEVFRYLRWRDKVALSRTCRHLSETWTHFVFESAPFRCLVKWDDAFLKRFNNLTSLRLVYLSPQFFTHHTGSKKLIKGPKDAEPKTQLTMDSIRSLRNLTELELYGSYWNQLPAHELASLPRLTHLQLLMEIITFSDTELIMMSDRLKSLTLSGLLKSNSKISERGLGSMTALTELKLEWIRFTDAVLEPLSQLLVLDLLCVDAMTGRSFQKLSCLKSLRLSHMESRIQDEGLTPLSKSLTSLDMSQTSITGRGIESLTNLVDLKIRSKCVIYNETISGLTKLETLLLNEALGLSDVAFSNLSNLTSCTIYHAPNLTGQFLASLTNLKLLDLAYCPSFKASHLKQLKKIEVFSLKDIAICDEELAPLTQLKSLSLGSRTVSQASLTLLTCLETLSLRGVDIVYEEWLSSLQALSSLSLGVGNVVLGNALTVLARLEYLSVGETESIHDEDILNLTWIRVLDLAQNKTITDLGIQNFTNLARLDLGLNSLITSEGLSHCVSLTELDLNDSPLEPEDLKALWRYNVCTISHD